MRGDLCLAAGKPGSIFSVYKHGRKIYKEVKNIMREMVGKLRRVFERTFKRRVYSNLVFKGGGVRGIAYMGALEQLEARGVLDGIERVAGTSSGAIAATLVSFRKSIPDTLALFNTLDLSQVPQKAANGNGRNIVLLKNSANYTRLFENFGWFSSQYFQDWLGEVIAGQCRGNRRATFKDFQHFGFRDLHVVATNLSRHRAETFSAHSTPDVAVVDAVRMSMSIPLYFEALRFDGKRFGDGDYFVDGGLFNNYPIHLFDQPRFAKESRHYRDGINWETLGLYLFPSNLHDPHNRDEPQNLWEFLDLTVRSIYDSHQIANLVESVADKKRTIQIDDCGITSTRFDISPESPEFNCLYNAGKQAVIDFFGTE
jgi:NTE family protein